MKFMAKKITRKEQIVAAAAQLFRNKGYNATTMRDLAEQVGMEAASLYNHIKSKEEILQYLCFKISDQYISQLNQIDQNNNSAAAKIREIIRLHIRIATTDVASVHVANNEWKHLSEPFLTDFVAARRSYEKKFVSIIQSGIDRQEFVDLHPTVALFTILSAVRWIELWYKPSREVSILELEQNIISMLMQGLEK